MPLSGQISVILCVLPTPVGITGQSIEPRKNFTIRLSDEEREQAEHDAQTNNMKLSDITSGITFLSFAIPIVLWGYREIDSSTQGQV